MNLFGLTITRREKALSPVAENRGGWFPLVWESFTGAWQQNVTIDRNLILTHHAVYACLTLISSDVAKLRPGLLQRDASGVWLATNNAAYDPVIRKPNAFQNRIQFWENYTLSKLMKGNTYVLKQRDERGVVKRLYVLDPNRTRPLVADDGSVFYELDTDNLTQRSERVIVPAREIIHDRINCLFHPLVGTSPLIAAGLAAMQGLNIQKQSAWFFGNRSMPGGILTAPGAIANDTAQRLKESWETNYGGENAGKVAVLGDGLKFEKIPISAEESQLIEQLKWTAEIVCSVFHVPPYKIGVGTMPTYNNIQSLNVEYYSQCLQSLIEAAELCLDEGLDLGSDLTVEFDLEGLLRMDSTTQMTVLKEGIAAGVFAPNEARAKLGYQAVEGGESPYLQQQNYSLAALAKRDAQDDPFGKAAPPELPALPEQLALPAPADAAEARFLDDTLDVIRRGLAHAA